MSFRLSMSCRLSLISFEATQVLIWSRSRWGGWGGYKERGDTPKPTPSARGRGYSPPSGTCSFLISFFRSASYFSFWLALAALWSCGGSRGGPKKW